MVIERNGNLFLSELILNIIIIIIKKFQKRIISFERERERAKNSVKEKIPLGISYVFASLQ